MNFKLQSLNCKFVCQKERQTFGILKFKLMIIDEPPCLSAEADIHPSTGGEF
jgi:hypothetical protein